MHALICMNHLLALGDKPTCTPHPPQDCLKLPGQLSTTVCPSADSLPAGSNPGTGSSCHPSSLHTVVQTENSLSFLGDKEQS